MIRRCAVIILALGLAACGSSSKSSTATSSSTAAPTSSAGPASTAASATVSWATNSTLGQVLIDAQGRTLYHNTKENNGTIVCTGACATTWPPVTVAAGTTPTGIANLATVTRPDGTTQLTYKGWPLYRFAQDTKAGDANGQGIAGIWYVVQQASSAGSTVPAGTPTTAYSGY